MVGGNGGVILAEQYVPTGVVALFVATAPLWMAIIDRVIFGRRLPPLVIVGLVIGFGGVAFLIGSPGSGHINLFGAALALAAPLCWASGSVFTRHVKLPVRPLVAASMEMLWAGLLFGALLSLPASRSEPGSLPSVCRSAVTSRTSSMIWKARPRASP